MRSTERTSTSLREVLGITVLCFGLPIYTSTHHVLQGFVPGRFSDNSLQLLILLELCLGGLALGLLRQRKFSLSPLYPAPSIDGMVTGALLYALICGLVWLVTAPLSTELGRQPIDAMVASAVVSLPVVVGFALVNSAYEEIFLLGVLQRGLRQHGLPLALGVALLVRLLYHLYQGPLGALSVLIFGLTLGLYYWRSGKLFPAVFAHCLADILPFLSVAR